MSHQQHAFGYLVPRLREGLTLHTRRSMLKASIAALAAPWSALGQSPPADALPRRKSVILLWMAGGPSHIDTWDVKPDAPTEVRGPFDVIKSRLPGVFLCEHLPKQAAMMDKLTIIRSVDCRASNHQPNQVMQTGNREAAPRVNREGDKYPAIAALAGRHLGPAPGGIPPYVALNVKDKTHIAWGGYLGKRHDPFLGSEVAGKFQLPRGLEVEGLQAREELRQQFDSLRRDMDLSGSMDAIDEYTRQAFRMVAGPQAREAFDLAREPEPVRQRYGSHDWCQQALLARRLVERGVPFVTLVLSNHHSSGTWDTHGDNIPPYGGISRGLQPLLPVFDHLLTTLVGDLEDRGLLDDVLVIAMGEFGRTPRIGTQESTDGRDHWPVVLSLTMAGGGLRHGQVIGATERDGGAIKERPVTPADLAATLYQHLGVPLDLSYDDFRGRPRFAIEENGQPLRELFG